MGKAGMVVGIDLDNTLICYDGVFHAAGVRNGMLTEECPRDKRGVRDWLIRRGREHDFTILQAEVYGELILQAPPYPEALECLRSLRAHAVPFYIVSHKTRFPAAGPRHDLREAARLWLTANGVVGEGRLPPDAVFFASDLNGKAATATRLGCTHFVDDMASFLAHPALPAAMEKILFAPPAETVENNTVSSGWLTMASWYDIGKHLCREWTRRCS